MQNNPDAIREAMRIAQTEAGQQLLRLLQQTNGQQLNQAISKAAAGDYDSARTLLNNLLNDPQAKELMRKMGGSHGSNGR